MFTSKALNTVGLVWKPIRHCPTTRRNDRAQAKRIADVEAFLKPYGLKKWNKTVHARSVNLKETNSVARDNFEVEMKKDAVRLAKREKAHAKVLAARAARAQAFKDGQIARDEAARKLVAKLQTEGSMRPYPTF